MANIQKFLLDDKKLGRLLKVDIFESTRTLKKTAISGKKATEIKKKYLLTVYNKVMVNEQQIADNGVETFEAKEKFVKWAEFDFSEVMHPKDRIIELLTKIERPLNYIPDIELMDELDKRQLLKLEQYPEELLIKEMKRRGITEFANNFKISKNATMLQKLIVLIKEHRKIPDTKLSFEETVSEIKKRHLLLPEDFITDEELLKELEKRDIRKDIIQTPEESAESKVPLESLFEEIPKSPDELDPTELTAHFK